MLEFIYPDWPAPAGVRALTTTRTGGVSQAPWHSLNLGTRVGDDPATVAENHRRLREHLPGDPVWLKQSHSTRCVDAAEAQILPCESIEADASFTRERQLVCAVQTADCLPVFFCDLDASVVAAAHAGWRGLAGGVLEATVAAMQVPPQRLLSWLGPAIGPQCFEVGQDVYAVFIGHDSAAASAFIPQANQKWLANIHQLARLRLEALGISRITSADFCTVTDADRFFSYRRDGVTGRMASCIWLE